MLSFVIFPEANLVTHNYDTKVCYNVLINIFMMRTLHAFTIDS
jgi:hypothetical protein